MAPTRASTKKAQRWFKERGIKYPDDQSEGKRNEQGRFDNVCRALGSWQSMVDETAKDKDTLALLRFLAPEQQADKLFENQRLIASPLCATDAGYGGLLPGDLAELGVISLSTGILLMFRQEP